MNRRVFLAAAVGVPVALASGRLPRALAGGTPLALVTADLESRLVAVELSSGRVLRHIETAPGPRSIESVTGTGALIAHTQHDYAVMLLRHEGKSDRDKAHQLLAAAHDTYEELGMHTFVRWNYIFVAPPLCITKEEIDEGLSIISEALKIADEYTIHT